MRQIGPLFSYFWYYIPWKVCPMVAFYSYEKSLVADTFKMAATAARSLARRGLIFSAIAMMVYFFQRRESAEGSSG
jgi:hypothetical protein